MLSQVNLRRWSIALALAAAVPMLAVTVPGAADYPNHLARLHVLSRIGQHTALDRYFAVDWRWIGNLGVDLPALLLTPLLGVESATQLVAALIAPLTVIGILMLSRSAHGRITGSAMLALPFALAQPYLFGFLNYCLSVALALIVAALWNAARDKTPLRLAGFAIAAIIVWTAHIMGWAILLILVAGAEFAAIRAPRDALIRALRAAVLLTPIIPLLLWRSDGGGRLFGYDPHLLTSKAMNFVTVLKGLSMPFDLAMTTIIGVGALLAFLSAGGRRFESRLAIGGGLLILAALVLPTTVLGSWGADLRLTPVAVMVAIMAIGPAVSPRRESLLIVLGVSLFLLRVGRTTALWMQNDALIRPRLAILDHVPFGSRLGFLAVASDCRTDWPLTPERKLGAYATVRRDSFTNTLFQIPGSDLMVFRAPADRALWFDGSQDIAARCPAGTPDLSALTTRIARMKADTFNVLWVAGIAHKAVPSLPGYTLAYASGNDTLFLSAATTHAGPARISPPLPPRP